MKMRIGFDAKRAFFNQSGLGNYSRTLISQLCTLFPENEYLLFSPKTNPGRFNFPPENTTTLYPSNFLHKTFPSIWRSLQLGTEIKKNNVSIFHGLSNELPLDIRNSGAKSVVTIHDLIFMRYPNLYKRADREIYRLKFQRSCKAADAVVAISRQTKNDIIQFLEIDEAKINVIYQGCNPLYYRKLDVAVLESIRKKYLLPSEYLLYVGTIEERKNLLRLIQAIHENSIPLPLLVVGKPTPYFEKICEYISRNNINGIIFLRNLTQEELVGIYQMAEVFVYPSSFEGFGIPILEALNSGIPVIAGKGSCMEETGGHHSIYVNPSDTGEIAGAILKVINNPSLKMKMSEEGHKQALLFREDKTAMEMMKLYQRLLD